MLKIKSNQKHPTEEKLTRFCPGLKWINKQGVNKSGIKHFMSL